MHGKSNHARTPYYYCQPRERERPDGHPATIWLRQDELINGLTGFFNIHVLGPDRLSLASRSIDAAALSAAEEYRQKVQAARRAVDDVKQRLDRLTTILEERDDPDGAVFARIQTRLSDLEGQLRERTAELAYLEASAPPDAPGPVEILEHLPELEIDLIDLPGDHLRRLLDAFAVQISYDKLRHRTTYRAQVSGHLIPHAAQIITASARTPRQRDRSHRGPADDGGATGRSVHSSVTCPAGGTQSDILDPATFLLVRLLIDIGSWCAGSAVCCRRRSASQQVTVQILMRRFVPPCLEKAIWMAYPAWSERPPAACTVLAAQPLGLDEALPRAPR